MALALTNRIVAHTINGVATATASFTPSNNSLLVVIFTGQDGGGGTDTWSITDSAGLTWTLRASYQDTTNYYYGIRIWTAPVTTGVSMTVTVTPTGGSGLYALSIVDVTGYNTSTPVGLTAGAAGYQIAGGSPVTYALSMGGTTASDSIVVSSAASENYDPNPATGWTDVSVGSISWFHWAHAHASGAMSNANWDDLRSDWSWGVAAIEIKAAGGAATKAPPRFNRAARPYRRAA